MLFFGKKKHGSAREERLKCPGQLGKILVRLEKVSLDPLIQNLTHDMELGSWTLLLGSNELAKALFCDLCFSFIDPQKGKVSPKLKDKDVSFLGRSNTTYGYTLLDHITCGTKDIPKDLLRFVANHVFTQSLKQLLADKNLLVLKDSKRMIDVDLSERDFLEIAEANILLQKRTATIVDTTTDFYRIALEQGFRHSDLFLNSGKTLLWIIDDNCPYTDEQAPWRSRPEIKKVSLYFSNETTVNLPKYIN